MKLPTFDEAKQAVIEKRGTPLDKFVAYWETEKEQEMFRNMLSELMDWAIPTCTMSQSEIEEAIADLPRHKDHPIPDVERLDRAITFNSFWNPTTGLYEEKR